MLKTMYYVAITDNSKLKGVEFADIIDCPTANFPNSTWWMEGRVDHFGLASIERISFWSSDYHSTIALIWDFSLLHPKWIPCDRDEYECCTSTDWIFHRSWPEGPATRVSRKTSLWSQCLIWNLFSQGCFCPGATSYCSAYLCEVSNKSSFSFVVDWTQK